MKLRWKVLGLQNSKKKKLYLDEWKIQKLKAIY